MSKFDQLHRYLFNQANVRGELVQLQDSFQSLLAAYDYPVVVKQLLGELMAATSLLTATLKFEGDIAVQVQSDGPLKYAVINGTHQQHLRGTARWDEAIDELPTDLSSLLPKGVLVITITPTDGERYQGIVAIDADNLATCLENYFSQSEQLPTRMVLHANTDSSQPAAGGMFLQVLPTSSEVSNVADRPEFTHLSSLTETIQPQELLTLPANEILHRLYHQETVEVFTPQDVLFKCSCSKARSAGAIAKVDKHELLEIVAQDGAVRMHCQYCHTEYQFDAIDIESIHSGAYDQPSTPQ